MINKLLKYAGYNISLCCVNINYNVDDEMLERYFDKDELEVIKNHKSIQKKYEYIHSRIACKSSISNLIKLNEYKKIHITKGVLNQPVVSLDGYPNKIITSLSHSNKKAVAISFNEELSCGIDIEEIKEENIHIISRLLTKCERNIINNYDTIEANIKFTIFWTAKEAVSKAIKVGFTSGFNILEISKLENFDNKFEGEYKSLKQYRFFSLFIDDSICTIAYPKVRNSDLFECNLRY